MHMVISTEVYVCILYSGKFHGRKSSAYFVDRLPIVKIFYANSLLYYITLCLYIEGEVTHAKFS